MSDAQLLAQGVCKRFREGENAIDVLRNLNLTVSAGEKVAIVGRSGSGKSTLLHILAGLDTPDAGTVVVRGTDLASANNDLRARVRGQAMGFVYQNHHLLPEFSALENVAMPLRITGLDKAAAAIQAAALLTEVGLAERLEHLPSQLSGGERQRVAVARAIAGEPDVVLADEPTGNLDADNALAVMRLLVSLSEQRQTAFVVVTHDRGMLHLFDRVLVLESGALVAVTADTQAAD
ncbi:MAG: ABC transporter ATP-binding protein [Pseudomonadota bacterium]